MRSTRLWITLTVCLFATVISGWAQNKKPGLWQTTTVQTWQQSPFPPGMATGPNSPMGAPHTSLVCLTQAQLDKYGTFAPESKSGGCTVSNIVKRSNGMSADWICTGAMSGKGSVESTWYDDGHSKAKVHFVGTLQAGESPRPVEFTSESTSIYKGPDCGSVKPFVMPEKK